MVHVWKKMLLPLLLCLWEPMWSCCGVCMEGKNQMKSRRKGAESPTCGNSIINLCSSAFAVVMKAMWKPSTKLQSKPGHQSNWHLMNKEPSSDSCSHWLLEKEIMKFWKGHCLYTPASPPPPSGNDSLILLHCSLPGWLLTSFGGLIEITLKLISNQAFHPLLPVICFGWCQEGCSAMTQRMFLANFSPLWTCTSCSEWTRLNCLNSFTTAHHFQHTNWVSPLQGSSCLW